jgi:Flp pilus assembly protein TadD
VVARGQGIEADVLLHDARIEDVAPTVLGRFGLEQPGLDGRCLVALVPDAPRRRIAPAPRVPPPRPDLAVDDLTALERRVVTTARLGTHLARAEALLAHGDVAGAASAYEAILREAPGDWPVRVRLARCRLQEGDLDACAALGADIVAAAPTQPWGHLIDATVAVLRRDVARAERALAATRERAAGLPNVSLRLASLYLLHGDANTAESLFRAALATMPSSVDAHDGLGCALHAQGRDAEAVDVLQAGLGHVYHAPLAHVHLGLALLALGRAADAADEARTARRQDPDVPGLATLEQRISHALAGRTRSAS